MRRRDFFKNAGIGSAALVSLPSFADALTGPVSRPSLLKKGAPPDDPFVILLQGTYTPVVRCPDLGLLQVDLCDGSYSTVKIYAVSGLAEHDNRGDRASDPNCNSDRPIGNFYVQFGGEFAVYDLPGGALTMAFTADHTVPVPDGHGGTFYVGTIELDRREATGIYQSFVGGHNLMVDSLHELANGTFVEYCFCIIRSS
jgi:hypothetical protein